MNGELICFMCGSETAKICIYVEHPNWLNKVKSLDLCFDCFDVIIRMEYKITKISSKELNMFE